MTKKRIKKILKWTGITMLALILILILIPVIFKDQIKEMVVEEVNKNLTAELEVGDFDLTFFSTFPNMTVQLHDTKLIGKDKFKGVELVTMKKMTAHVGFWSVVFGDQVEVDEIHIEDPVIDIRILEDGSANYDIVKSDEEKTKEELEEPSNFKLSLQKYSVKNGKIRYDDKLYDIYMLLENVEHSGKGDFTAETFDFETTTKVDKCSYKMYGIDYLTEVKTDAVINLYMEFSKTSSKFTFKNNDIKLNAVDFSLEGYYEMFDGYDDMDLRIDASKTSFKDFLSLIPAFYRTGYESMVSSGNLSLKGIMKGTMDETNMPAWDFGVKVNNGSLKYAGLPGEIKDIQVDAATRFPGGEDMNKMTVEVPEFHAKLGNNMLDANLFLGNLEVDPHVKSGLHANIDLSTIKNFVPLPTGETYSGILDADVDLDGSLIAIEQGSYDQIKADGILELSRMLYASPDLSQDVRIDHLKLSFTPQKLALNDLKAYVGNSDFQMDGTIEKYYEYVFTETGNLEGTMNLTSDYMDLDELMNVYPEQIDVTQKAAKNASKQSYVMEPTGPTLVPANLDFTLNTNIQRATYNGIEAGNIKGKTAIKNQEATLRNFSMKAMGGTIELTGSYNTRNPEDPQFDFDYTLKDVDIEELTTNFLTVGKLAPLAKYAKGRISSNFSMNSSLDNNLMPVLNSVSSHGDISSKILSIGGIPLLKKIESATKLNNLSSQSISNFRTHFSVSDGKVILTPFKIKLGKIPTTVSGYTTLDKEMNYKFAMNIPKSQIPAALLKEVEDGMTMINGLHPDIKLGELPATIKANVFAMGDPKNPKITTDLHEVLKQAIKDRVGNVIEDTKDLIIDSVQTIIEDKTEEIKAEIEAQKKKILDEAQKRADQIKAEGKRGADAVRDEAKKQGDRLIEEAGTNFVKKKLAETAAKKLAEEAEKKAQDIENEANRRADEIMQNAQEQADKLG